MPKVLVIGQQGSGKSLLGVYLSRTIQDRYSETTIYTNMNLDQATNVKTITDLSQIPFDRTPKILIVDEAMFTLDSRSHGSRQNKIWTRAQAFFRKANFLLVLYLTHEVGLIDNRMRGQLDYIFMCRKNKRVFDYLAIDMQTQKTKPFYLPKHEQIFNKANFDTHDFPPPITVDGLADDVIFKIAK